MEYRRLGASGFSVPVLSFGAGTFGGKGQLFRRLGQHRCRRGDPPDRHLPRCRAHDVRYCRRLFWRHFGADPGAAIKGRRDKLLISTKATFRFGDDPNDVGSSRFHLLKTVDEQLKRLGTDYIDLFQLHGFDAKTPVEEVLSTLDDLVRAGRSAEILAVVASTP